MMEALVTTRTYNPDNGLIRQSESDMISFGTISPLSKSNIIILDCVISNVSDAGNLGLGVAATDLTEQLISETLYYSILDSLDNLTGLTNPSTPFSGISGYDGADNVIDVGFRSPLVSKYIALMLHSPSRATASKCLVLKWFFGFSKKEI